MRHSDATFLRREVLPLLFKLGGVVPEAVSVADAITERLHDDEMTVAQEPILVRRHRLPDELGGPDSAWFVTLDVDGHTVPYIRGVMFDEGERAGQVSLVLDDRFVLDTDVEEVNRWASWLANAMAVSAGRTSHGPNSYVRNPHGRSGAGDPPELVGELLVAEPLRWPDPDGLRVLRAALDELGVPHSETPAPVANAVRLLQALVPAEVE